MPALNCPCCGKTNDDNWPLQIAGLIMEGGCQECWEIQCARSWWKAMVRIDEVMS